LTGATLSVKRLFLRRTIWVRKGETTLRLSKLEVEAIEQMSVQGTTLKILIDELEKSGTPTPIRCNHYDALTRRVVGKIGLGAVFL